MRFTEISDDVRVLLVLPLRCTILNYRVCVQVFPTEWLRDERLSVPSRVLFYEAFFRFLQSSFFHSQLRGKSKRSVRL